MDKLVISHKECMKCNAEINHILRSESVNKSLTDSDIQKMISLIPDNPYTMGDCEECESHTLQMKVGFTY